VCVRVLVAACMFFPMHDCFADFVESFSLQSSCHKKVKSRGNNKRQRKHKKHGQACETEKERVAHTLATFEFDSLAHTHTHTRAGLEACRK